MLVPPLSAQQFKLLWLLYESSGQVISRADLVTTVWGEEQASGVSIRPWMRLFADCAIV